MIDWVFYLDDTEIEEPIGFSDIELSIKRDPKLHGFSFEASTSPLQFFGIAYDYLEAAYLANGVNANVIFKALFVCEGGYDYTEAVSGRLNFGKRKTKCGSLCLVELPLEEESCAVIFSARYDQKVDVDKAVGVDNTSQLQEYTALAVETELPAHETQEGIEGYVNSTQVIDTEIPIITNPARVAIRPDYDRQIRNTINEGNLESFNNVLRDPIDFDDPPLTPQLLLDDTILCFPGNFDYNIVFNGSVTIEADEIFLITHVKVRLVTWDATGDFFDNSVLVAESTVISAQPVLANTPYAVPFNVTLTGSTAIASGLGLYAYLELVFDDVGGPTGIFIDGSFSTSTYFNLTAVKSCPATNAELYMIHETLSRVAEAITNNCIRVKSEYYGRTDSEPFEFDADGCGGLRSLTSGLKIRRATEDKFFASMKELIDGLNAIDNIGIGIEVNPAITAFIDYLLRVEDVAYFYQDNQLLLHDYIPDAETVTEETAHYSKINVGYKKWEVETESGLDEFNSNRQYNTAIDTINSTLDITSGLIAGTYPIEITRQQSFADSGGADTKFDNDIFIICMKRDAYPYGNISVEQDAVDNPLNVFSPETMYNWRISPVRNLMRWYKSIAAGFAQISDATMQLFFSSGTGNLTASAILTDTLCRMENTEIQENQNIFVTHFITPADYTPIWKNEIITYEYPMSLAEYQEVKAAPYGYISAQCGYGDVTKYWIMEIKYKPAKGIATFTLKRKYGV